MANRITQDAKGVFNVFESEYIDGYENVTGDKSYLLAHLSEFECILLQLRNGNWERTGLSFVVFDHVLFGTPAINVPGVIVEITHEHNDQVELPTDVLLFMAKCLVAAKYPGVDSNAGSIGSMGYGYSAYVGGTGDLVEG